MTAHSLRLAVAACWLVCVATPLYSQQPVQLGVFSLERTVAGGGSGIPGVIGFQVVNLTGTNALPPEAPVTDNLMLTGATITYTLQGAGPVTVAIGDLAPGGASLPQSLRFPDTAVIVAAEFRANLGTRLVNASGFSQPLSLSPAAVVVPLPISSQGVIVPGVAVAPILVTGAPAQRLAFLQQPTNAAAGATLTPPVTVQVLDAQSAVVTSSNASITLTSNPAGVTATQSAVNGVATFPSLVFANPGAYTLTATAAAAASATSNSFTISSRPPAQLSFVANPAGGVVGVPLAPVSVRLLDSQGNPTSSNAPVTLTSTPAGVTSTVGAINGVATFGNLVFPRTGFYTLTASSTGLTSTATASFAIGTAAVSQLTVAPDSPAYSIGAIVTLRGRVADNAGVAIGGVPVVLTITQQASSRAISVTSAVDGAYSATLTTTSADTGLLQVTATASAGGASRSASTTFRVVGLSLTLADPTIDVVMGTTARPAFVIRNAGDAPIAGLRIIATPSTQPTLTSRLNVSGVPASLARGSLANFTLDLTAATGMPPAQPAVFTVTVNGVDSVSGLAVTQISQLTVTLRPATASPMLSPLTATLGVNAGRTSTQQYSVRNDGFVAIDSAQVSLVRPGAPGWVSITDQNLGRIEPGQVKSFQLVAAPPTGTVANTYAVPFLISGGGTPLAAQLAVNVSSVSTGNATFNVVNDLGLNVAVATVTLIGRANPALTYSGATDSTGNVTLTGVTAGDYSFLVTAPGHSPAVGGARVSPGGSVQPLAAGRENAPPPPPTPIQVVLSYDVVTLTFAVVPTTIADEYQTELRVRYSTFLVKPVLRVLPTELKYSFLPQETYPPFPQCIPLEIENLHPTTPVTDITLDSTVLDQSVPANLRFGLRFFLPNQPLTGPGSPTINIGTLDGRNFRPQGSPPPIFKKTVIACGTVNKFFLESRSLGSLPVSGQYEYSGPDALGNVVKKLGTTSTPVPVTYDFPEDIYAPPINLIHDPSLSPNDLRPLDPNFPSYFFQSLRSESGDLLKPANAFFGGRNVVAFAQRATAPPALTRAKRNLQTMLLNQPWWRTDFKPEKQRLTARNEAAIYDISAIPTSDPCRGLSLVECLQARLATSDRSSVLGLPLWAGTSIQWADRLSGPLPGPDGYLAPIKILQVSPAGVITSGGGGGGGASPIPLPRTCAPQNVQGEYVPVECGQILIAIDFRNGLERQAFNASLGIAPAVPLTQATAEIRTLNSDDSDAADLFTIVLGSEDTQGATRGGTVASPQVVKWQIIPKLGAGGTSGKTYKVVARFRYTLLGVAYAVQTEPVTITVAPQPELQITHAVPFLVVQKKPARIRIRVQNFGSGPALNFNVSSPTPIRILARPGLSGNPPLPTNFTLVGSSSTENGSTYQDGVKAIEFGQIPGQSTVAGFFNLVVDDCIANPLDDASLWRRITNCGYIVDSTATMKQSDFRGVQLDSLLREPRVEFIPALGGTVSNVDGTKNGIGGLTVRATGPGGRAFSDTTDADGGYFLQDLVPGQYRVQVLTGSGTVLGDKTADVILNSSTDFLNFAVTPPSASVVRISFATQPPGLAYSVDGVEYRAPQSFNWVPSTRHTVSLTRTQSLGNALQTRYVFALFSGGLQPSSSVGPIASAEIMTPSQPASYNAIFTTQHNISGSASPSAGGVVNGPTGFVPEGVTVSLTATANTGYRFANWSGDLSGTVNPATVLVNAPKTISANFAPLTPILSASITARSGEASARSWTITLSNAGIGVAEAPEITGISVVAAGAPGCSVAPRVVTPLPASLATVMSLGRQSTSVVTDFSGCAAAQRFTVSISYRANGGTYANTTTLNNQFR